MTTDHQAQVDAAREECNRLILELSDSSWKDREREKMRDAIDRLAALASAPSAPAASEMALKALDGIDLAVSATPGLTVVQLGEALAVIGRYSKTIRDSLGTDVSMLRHLLARIHGDGGHYVDEHGIEKAFANADALVAEWRSAPAASEPRVLGAGLDPWPNPGDLVAVDAFRAPDDDDRAALLELWSTHIDASVRAELMAALVRYLDALPDESNREWAPKGRPSVDLPGSS